VITVDDDGAEIVPSSGSPRDLVRWSETLAAIARTGLGFSENLYERERFEEVLNVAADIKAAANEALGHTLAVDDQEAAEVAREQDHFVQEWLESVGVGVPGYVTPKVAIGAVVGNEDGELLLVQRADSGIWLYPTGWADVGYSPAEVAVKEVAEETGIECEVERLIAVFDGMRQGFSRIPLYSLVFLCRATGGTLEAHPLECADVGWFGPDELPSPLAGADRWGDLAFAAIGGEVAPTYFDLPRDEPWRGADGRGWAGSEGI